MLRARHFLIYGALLTSALVACGHLALSHAQPVSPSQVDVNLVTDEADAVLTILSKKNAKQTLTEVDWQRLFTSEGYTRLKTREAAMRRTFEEAEFKTFVLSDKLSANAPALAETLKRWKRASVSEAARRALAYIPKGAHIHAKIYPVIKPTENSFVFEADTDPAIFLYVDPTVTKEQFENTLAHELHHIGYSSSCPTKEVNGALGKQPQNIHFLMNWIGAFGEGFAMLAAAGGPNHHPHEFSKPEDRARWEKDVANFNTDLKKVDQFFLDILHDKLNEEQIRTMGFSFFGVQGPWYTVGWKMSVIIERKYGRARLIECICDQRKLLATYNQVAAEYNRTAREPVALWSPAIIEALHQTEN